LAITKRVAKVEQPVKRIDLLNDQIRFCCQPAKSLFGPLPLQFTERLSERNSVGLILKHNSVFETCF
jgi:hypothetical protein